jgi:hypothetical protein
MWPVVREQLTWIACGFNGGESGVRGGNGFWRFRRSSIFFRLISGGLNEKRARMRGENVCVLATLDHVAPCRAAAYLTGQLRLKPRLLLQEQETLLVGLEDHVEGRLVRLGHLLLNMQNLQPPGNSLDGYWIW